MGNLTEKNMIKAYLQLVKVESNKMPGWGVQSPRICGYLEACLQNLGVLSSEEELPYEIIGEYRPYFFFGNKLPIYETYSHLINRLCLKYIKDNNIKTDNYLTDTKEV